MELSLAQVEHATGARLIGCAENELRDLRAKQVRGWSVDSRTIARGDLFFAIKGENFDGHAFLAAAFAAGACGSVVSETLAAIPGPLLQVDDTVRALRSVASCARLKWKKPLIAITGSAGKTGTKEIVAALLGARFRVGKTIGNLNNHIGLPLTLLRLPSDSELAVVEMGMNHAGEIRHLASIARPQIGVITNIGYAHIEAFQSIEGIAAAKGELIESLPPEGVAVLNADDERVLELNHIHTGRVVTYGIDREADIKAEQVAIGTGGSEFSVRGVRFRTKLTGKHAVANILAGLAVASIFEIPFAELSEIVAELTVGKMRGERRMLRGATIIDDSYNSNPEAARSMIDVLRREPSARRIAVLGEMLELGSWAEALHRDVGGYAAANGVDVLVGVGGASRWMVDEALRSGMNASSALFFENSESAGEFLRDYVKTGDALLFKGSRGAHVEKALAKMEE